MPKEEIVNLALRRALFYPAAEIYSSAASGFFDFGPLGETIRRKVIGLWRKQLVEKEGMLEIFGAQILPEDVFRASGHLENFNDPIVQCRKCNSLHRADNLVAEKAGGIVPESLATAELDKLIEKHAVKCPKCGGKDFNEVRKFNMMMGVGIGATGKQAAYLRPETCQSIFCDFPRLFKSSRENLPLAIAQAGSSFRNEIAPRNTLLREREIGQMEVEIFFNPHKIDDVENFAEVQNYKLNLMLLGKKPSLVSCSEAVKKKLVSGKLIAYYLARTQQLYEAYGIPVSRMRFRQLGKDEKAFYARETWDFEVETDLGWIELIACNYRTDYDLKGHERQSRHKMSVKEDGKEFIPHVFELSAGIDRTFYVVLDNSFRKEKRGKEERIYLKLPARVAPYDAGIYPLVKKDGLAELARKVFEGLIDEDFDVFYDEKGSIGKRYSRADEAGVFGGITIDYQTKEDNTVTYRCRDSMEQERVKVSELPAFLRKARRQAQL
ncbi:MAG: glycine--tRNA ligase [Candidatus Diapherotrites archaeon]|uniref:glycine--tRNA ligase n=1 Tax=Candidatus Iainarchaeum sp. TaxID=3101447 RepID=A0A938YWS6_9ARCH|nr:glycine--tRNA ligase [Candidatus Diapherotrites archaeon]